MSIANIQRSHEKQKATEEMTEDVYFFLVICFLSSFRILAPMVSGHLGTEAPFHAGEQTRKSHPMRDCTSEQMQFTQ